MRISHGARDGRRLKLAGAIVCSALILTGCVSTKGSPGPAVTESIAATIVAIGKPASTPAGNIVTVHSFLSPVGPASGAGAGMIYAAADIEACAGANAPSQTGVAPNLFVVQTADQAGWTWVNPVKQPALRASYLAAGHCARGWVTFRLPKTAKAAYVVFFSSAVIKWKIP